MGLFGPDPATSAALARIEAKLDRLLEALDVESPQSAGADEQVLNLVRQGRKIEAIKLHRERTGLGLAEAKAYVDSLG